MPYSAQHKDYYTHFNPSSFTKLKELGLRVDVSFSNLDLLDAAIFWMTNVEREKNGLAPFRFHYKLRQMAILHSEQMRLHKFFSHENPYEARYKTLDDRLDAMKDGSFDGFRTWGENIAQYPTLNGPNSFSVEFRNGIPHFFAPDGSEILHCTCKEFAYKVVDGWMHSPGHRANILNPQFEYLGCGCAGFEEQGNSVAILYFNLTQNFGGGLIPCENNNRGTFNPCATGPINKTKSNALFGGWGQNIKVKNMAKNAQQWSSATPGLLIILLDQSGSMLQQYEGSDSRTVFASRAVNHVIDNIVQKNFYGEAPKNRCFISVIGYNQNVNELCSGWLSDLAANPLRYENLKQKQPDGAGDIVEVEIQQPVWVEPIKNDGTTNMFGAFKLAKELAQKWISDNPTNPAPVIINISDGVPYYDGKDPRECMKETTGLAKEIMSLSNDDGNVLIFNAQIDNKGNSSVVFPTDRSKLSQEEAQFLFDITSEVPESYKAAAEKNSLPVVSGARGCIFNADGVQLIQLIDFGSSKGQGTDKVL